MAFHNDDARTRILVLRPDHLGDILLTFPALGALRAALPHTRIDLLVVEGMEEVGRLCPVVDKVRTVPVPDLALPLDAALVEQIARSVAPDLEGQYDVALLPRPDDPWTAPVAAAAGIPCRIGFDRSRTRPFLTVTVPEPTSCHAAELALKPVTALISLLGQHADSAHLPSHGSIRLEDQHRAEAASALLKVKERTGPCPVIMHPGTGWALKNWPVTRWGELAHVLNRACDVTPLVLGGTSERNLVDAVLQAADGATVSLTTPLSVGGLAALYGLARLVIAADSGPLHLAAMMGTPVVGLYGPADPTQFAPLAGANEVRVVRVDLPCSPCGTLLHPPCGAAVEPACVAGITIDAVMETASELLGRVKVLR